MSRPIRAIPAFAAACLAAGALAACGSSGGAASGDVAQLASEDTVAQLGSQQITQALLAQWMEADVGATYYEVTKRRAPPGLVSEPPDVPACEAAVKAVAPILSKGEPQTAAQLKKRCELLYVAVKSQMLTFLVAAYWNIHFGAAHGVNVTNAEVQHSLEQVKAQQYPKPGQFQASLDLRRRTLSQELFLAKIDLLVTKLKPRVASKGTLSKEASTSAEDVICRAEYVVPHCKQFKGRVYSGPSPAALLRE